MGNAQSKTWAVEGPWKTLLPELLMRVVWYATRPAWLFDLQDRFNCIQRLRRVCRAWRAKGLQLLQEIAPPTPHLWGEEMVNTLVTMDGIIEPKKSTDRARWLMNVAQKQGWNVESEVFRTTLAYTEKGSHDHSETCMSRLLLLRKEPVAHTGER